MPNRPRAIVKIDVPIAGGLRTVTITVPAIVEQFRPGEQLNPAVADRILVDLRGTLERLGAPLDDDAVVIVDRVDDHLAWCRVTTG
jgi:hypothetical protein